MISKCIFHVGAALALGSSASAQALSWTQSGSGVNSNYAQSVAIAGDVDGDGFDDVIEGDPDASPLVFLDGEAKVYSGADGAVIYTYAGGVLDGLGVDVDGAGDVDQDGFADFVITSVEQAPVVYSGVDGSPLFAMTAVGSLTCESVAGAGDVDLDGYPDVIVGSSAGAAGNGRAWVFSGAYIAVGTPPQILYVFDGAAAGSGSLIAVDGAGDVNGDGHADLIVGQYAESGMVGPMPYCGIARVYSGADGTMIQVHRYFGACSGFGFSVAGAGDLDGDGFGEVIVGAPFEDTNGSNAGLARVFAGSNGALLYSYTGNDGGDQFGRSVDGTGDVNGDHFRDFLIGSPVDETAGGGGAVWMYSGRTGALMSVLGEQGGTYGIALAGGADFDGDDFSDFAISAPASGSNGELYAYAGICTGANYGYCTASPNTFSPNGGSITASGSTSIATDDLTLLARECPPNQHGIFFYGTQQQQIPFGDGTLCVGGSFFRIAPSVQIDPIGIATLALDMTAPPLGSGPGAIEAGDTRYFSFWFRDPLGGPAGFNYTNGRVLTFCP